MPRHTHYAVTDGVGIVTIDNPPVNALGAGVLEEIQETIAAGDADPDVLAIVVVGAGSTFVAGADINLFKTLRTREEVLTLSGMLHDRLARIEDSGKPVVAAIHGAALGGGLELAMACHARIATSTAAVGQPEVLLGLIPGAGGTQRLPRLCGPRTALDLCVSGHPIRAPRAQQEGIVDRIVEGDREKLVDQAVSFARELGTGGSVRRTRERVDKLTDRETALETCATYARQTANDPARGPAPYAAVLAIEAAVTLDFDAGSAVERDLFATCLLSEDSRALIHLFFAEREAAKVADVPRNTPISNIARAAILGSSVNAKRLARAYRSAGIQIVEIEHVDSLKAADLEECLIVAAKPLDIDEAARLSGRPTMVVGHYLVESSDNGPGLIEIVRGTQTSSTVVASSLTFAKRLGRVAVVTGPCRGSATARLMARYAGEVEKLRDEGLSLNQIDRALTRFGMAKSALMAIEASSRMDPSIVTRVADQEIVDRVIAGLGQEAADLLTEGCTRRASDVDVISCYGLGFPRAKGGILYYSRSVRETPPGVTDR